jgi:hypothetical protein
MTDYLNSNGNLALSQPPNQNIFAISLKNAGIDVKGYGALPKYVMLDPTLDKDAKGLYAYFCTFGKDIHPSLRTISLALRINTHRVNEAVKLLCEQGYVMKKRQFDASNCYALVSTPKKFGKKPAGKERPYEKAYAAIREGGLKSYGYGKIPSAIFHDGRLEFGSKLIYAFHCVYAGFGKNGKRATFPEVDYIREKLDNMSEGTYGKYQRELVKTGYISATQRHDRGKFGVCDYVLNDKPDADSVDMSARRLAIGKINESGNKFIVNSVTTFAKGVASGVGAVKEALAGAAARTVKKVKTAVKPATKPVSKKSTLEETRDILQNNALSGAGRKAALRALKDRIADEIDISGRLRHDYSQNRDEMEAAIHYLTEFDTRKGAFSDEYENAAFNLVNEALIEMCLAKQPMTLRGAHVTYAHVIDRLNTFIYRWHSCCYLDKIVVNAMEDYSTGAATTEIKNPLKYMQAVLWTVMQVGDISVQSQIKRDFGGFSGKPPTCREKPGSKEAAFWSGTKLQKTLSEERYIDYDRVYESLE